MFLLRFELLRDNFVFLLTARSVWPENLLSDRWLHLFDFSPLWVFIGPRYPWSDLWVRVSLIETHCVDLTDVTLADEDKTGGHPGPGQTGPGRMFLNSSLAHVINTRASTCTIYTC